MKSLNTAPDILRCASDIMEQRAAQYDQVGGERSMRKIVATFNALKNKEVLTESDGWLFMILLKVVRDSSGNSAHEDSLHDLVAYASLFAESRLAGG